jgi:hypothetical protein
MTEWPALIVAFLAVVLRIFVIRSKPYEIHEVMSEAQSQCFPKGKTPFRRVGGGEYGAELVSSIGSADRTSDPERKPNPGSGEK